jgi:hypothetical protein
MIAIGKEDAVIAAQAKAQESLDDYRNRKKINPSRDDAR